MTGGWEGILHALAHAGALKRLPRQGWVDRGVPAPESVADHSYRLALLVLLLAAEDPAIDLAHALTLALVHDLPEAIAGDATPFDDALAAPDADREAIFRQRPAYSAAAEQAKRAAEAAAMRQITAALPASLARRLMAAWEEYAAGETATARLVRQADKLETWLQALEYRAAQPDLIIESFRIGTEEAVTEPRLRDLLAAIQARFGVG
ncbi:MAG: HD domain-containing protein [Sphaerobacter sp.]|nr:HD domain-containing protein [Sphaerobacter sp.]